MLNTIKKSYSLLNAREKRSGFLLLLVSVIKGLADTIGVASILPFLNVLSAPDRIETNPMLAWVYETLGYNSTSDFLFALGVFVIITLAVSAIVRAFTTYLINRWSEMREYSLSCRLLEVYLRNPYEYYLPRNSASMTNAILGLVRNVVYNAYRSFLNIMNGLITFALIFGLLIWANPVVTMVAVALIGTAYLAIYLLLKPFILRMGRVTVDASRERYKTVGETFSAVKQIKLAGRERFYLDQFAKPSLAHSRARAITATLNQVPRFGLEFIAFGGIILLTLSIVSQTSETGGDSVSATLPLIGLYALAGYRILPVIQSIYAAFSQILVVKPAIDEIYDDLAGRDALPRLPRKPATPLELRSSVAFRGITFRYPSAKMAGLRDIDLEIQRGMTVGIVGTTGAGKTTLMDILLGLLNPTEGDLLIDGVPLTHENIRNWQASIGYVPQDIELSDKSVSNNIAMGVKPEDISQAQVEDAARLAKIHDFIISDMPEGYDTEIGERGLRLSGGQRQRFGIARALYHNPSVVVFDEATSALDTATEKEVMDAIDGLSKSKTIFMIAHRLSTIEKCDKIIVMDHGQVVGFDNYDGLLAGNDVFRSLASGNSIAKTE